MTFTKNCSSARSSIPQCLVDTFALTRTACNIRYRSAYTGEITQAQLPRHQAPYETTEAHSVLPLLNMPKRIRGTAPLPPPPTVWRWLITNWLVTDPNYTSTGRPLKNYQVQHHSDVYNIYFLGGRFRVAKRRPVSAAVAIVIVGCGVLFSVFEASWFWHHLSPAPVVVFAYLWFLLFMFFVKCCTSDPGIQPRNLHLPMSVENLAGARAPDEYFNLVSLPYYSDKYHGVTVKYCATCHIWRLPRMSHCGTCNCCVLVHDHHCLFLNNCIGSRNYRYFLWFLVTTVAACVLLAVISFVRLFHYRRVSLGIHCFSQSAALSPVSLLLAIIALSAFTYTGLLLAFHVFLTANNITTREYLTYMRPSPDYTNVFDSHSLLENLWLNWIAAPLGISLVMPKEQYVSGDLKLEHVRPLKSFDRPVGLRPPSPIS